MKHMKARIEICNMKKKEICNMGTHWGLKVRWKYG